jgi:hypothetical protein
MQGTSEDPPKKKNHVKLHDIPAKLSSMYRAQIWKWFDAYQRLTLVETFFFLVDSPYAVPKAKLFHFDRTSTYPRARSVVKTTWPNPTLSLSARALQPGCFIASDGALSSTPPPRVNCPLRLRLMRVVKQTNDWSKHTAAHWHYSVPPTVVWSSM